MEQKTPQRPTKVVMRNTPKFGALELPLLFLPILLKKLTGFRPAPALLPPSWLVLLSRCSSLGYAAASAGAACSWLASLSCFLSALSDWRRCLAFAFFSTRLPLCERPSFLRMSAPSWSQRWVARVAVHHVPYRQAWLAHHVVDVGSRGCRCMISGGYGSEPPDLELVGVLKHVEEGGVHLAFASLESHG